MTPIYVILTILLLTTIPTTMKASKISTLNAGQSTYKDSLRGKNIALVWTYEQFGKCTIFYKDGSRTTNAIVREIKTNHVVVEKNGNLHDVEIEKIKWFQCTKNPTIYLEFDESKMPFLWFDK